MMFVTFLSADQTDQSDQSLHACFDVKYNIMLKSCVIIENVFIL